MSSIPYTAGLHALAPSTFAYLQPNGSWGLSNCGLVASGDEAVLVDTQFTLALTRRLLDAVAVELPGTTITTVVNTHANGDHCWGNELLPHAEIVGSADTAAGMPDEIPPTAMTAMIEATPADSPLGDYMRRFFNHFDFAGITITPPTRKFSGQTSVKVGDRSVELMEVGPAHTSGDVIAYVPDSGVVFAGDILFIGDHPVMWSGPIENWVRACHTILATGAHTIVPGHGPVTDRAGVTAFRIYLEYVGEYAKRQCELGVPYHVAAAQIPMHGYADWGHRERLVLTIGAIYRNLGQPDPGGQLALIGRMAEMFANMR